MLRTLTIPPQRWPSFFRLLNRLARERPTRLEVVGREAGDQEMARLLPFHSLEMEPKGSERGSLTLTLGSNGGEYTHRIVHPARVYAAQNDSGAIEWLAIEEMGEVGEAKTLVHFEDLPALQAEFSDVPLLR